MQYSERNQRHGVWAHQVRKLCASHKCARTRFMITFNDLPLAELETAAKIKLAESATQCLDLWTIPDFGNRLSAGVTHEVVDILAAHLHHAVCIKLQRHKRSIAGSTKRFFGTGCRILLDRFPNYRIVLQGHNRLPFE